MTTTQQALFTEMDTELYPLLLEPVLEKPAWSGRLLTQNYPEVHSGKDAGIVWQVIDDGALQSKVANGAFKGKPLRSMVEDNPVELVGKGHRAHNPFPLCCRLLDVGEDQPLGVHPAAGRQRDKRQPQSNTKFWYVLAKTGNARLYAGIAQRVTGQQLFRYAGQPEKFCELVRSFPAREGDAFLIPPGFIHGIGGGNLIWELQERNVAAHRFTDEQNSADILEEERQAAIDALIVESRHNPRISRESSHFTHTRRIPLTRHCPCFLVDEVRLFDHTFLRTAFDSFHLLVMIQGQAVVEYKSMELKLDPGQLCCIPASLGEYKVSTVGEPAEFLRVRRPSLT